MHGGSQARSGGGGEGVVHASDELEREHGGAGGGGNVGLVHLLARYYFYEGCGTVSHQALDPVGAVGKGDPVPFRPLGSDHLDVDDMDVRVRYVDLLIRLGDGSWE